MGKEQQWVAFRIAEQAYALPIAAVREIVRAPNVTPVPQSPDHVAGVTNLRGRIIPVVDLRKRLQGGPEARGIRHKLETSSLTPQASRLAKARVLVLTVRGKLIGMLVDEASEVLRIALAEVDPNPIPPGRDGDNADSYVSGIAKHQGRLIVLLDAEKLLQVSDSSLQT